MGASALVAPARGGSVSKRLGEKFRRFYFGFNWMIFFSAGVCREVCFVSFVFESFRVLECLVVWKRCFV